MATFSYKCIAQSRHDNRKNCRCGSCVLQEDMENVNRRATNGERVVTLMENEHKGVEYHYISYLICTICETENGYSMEGGKIDIRRIGGEERQILEPIKKGDGGNNMKRKEREIEKHMKIHNKGGIQNITKAICVICERKGKYEIRNNELETK